MMHHIITTKGEFLFIQVNKDSYRFTLISNPELKHRYGMFEWTDRSNGKEHHIHVPVIEQWEVFSDTAIITNMEWEDIVDKSEIHDKFPFTCYTPHWKYSKFKVSSCSTAANSGHSLLESRRLLGARWVILRKIKKNKKK
jgi:hypothetical protein